MLPSVILHGPVCVCVCVCVWVCVCVCVCVYVCVCLCVYMVTQDIIVQDVIVITAFSYLAAFKNAAKL